MISWSRPGASRRCRLVRTCADSPTATLLINAREQISGSVDGVGVNVAVGVGVLVDVAVNVAVMVGVAVGVEVKVAVGVDVLVEIAVGVMVKSTNVAEGVIVGEVVGTSVIVFKSESEPNDILIRIATRIPAVISLMVSYFRQFLRLSIFCLTGQI
jgi:hypothetical protein